MSVHVHDLTRRFVAPDGSVVPVIDVPLLELRDNEQVALTGTSGLGKTTLLHLLAGILRPDSGSIVYQLNGRSTDIAGLSEPQRDIFRGRHIGYVFQTHHLLPAFTALENVLLGMSFGGRHDRAWATHLLERVGLGPRLSFRPAKLSVGQQQRVAVARALANRPAVVLADEPTGALDAANAQAVLALIRELCAEVQATLLLVTHDQGIAAGLPRSMDLAQVNRIARAGTAAAPVSTGGSAR